MHRIVHISKLAVGVHDVAHLAALQAARTGADGMLRHTTRLAPRREAELLGGGSLYWVIGGLMCVRQLVRGIEPAARDDGSPGTALILDPAHVAVRPRAVRPFQGWRYLEAADAPPDDTVAGASADEAALPPDLRGALRRLALL